MENKETLGLPEVSETLHIPDFEKLLAEAPEPSKELMASVSEYLTMKVPGKDNTLKLTSGTETMKKIAVLDTETSGVGQGHGVCDLAIVFVDEDFNELDSYESLVDPECKISPSAMGIHHITNEMVEFEPTLAEAMDAWHFPLAGVDVVVGHNVRFDIRFLKSYIPVDALIIDTYKLSRQTWVREVENHKLQTLRYHFNLAGGEAHRAMGDVKVTISLCKLLCERYNTDSNGLLAMMSETLPLTMKMVFGKHKGVMLKDIPLDYVHWLLEKADNLDEDLRATLLTRLK